ncbi:MAG: flagellar basal body-associated FliL family protein, partial [Bdellovibrionia bacterium]
VLLVGGGLLPPKFRSTDYLSSLETVATNIESFDPAEPMEDFNSPLRHPEHVVILRKVAVNLRPSRTSSASPMAIFELFVEAGSKDAAVEIKDREKEMVDLTARVAEGVGYDDFSVADGKEKFKNAVRRELNKVLNTGRVRKVYFKTVVIKR